MEYFKLGFNSTNWTPFINLFHDDAILWFPFGRFRGENKGKEKIAEFFRFVAQTFGTNLTIDYRHFAYNPQNELFVTLISKGVVRGRPYENRVSLMMIFKQDKISLYEEYFGLSLPSQ